MSRKKKNQQANRKHKKPKAPPAQAKEISPASQQEAISHYNLGLAYAKQGRFAEAIPCFQEAIKIDPNYANAHGNLGAAYENQGHRDKAISHLEKAIALGKNDVPIHYNLGLAYAKQGRWDEAVPCFQKAIALDPNDALAANAHGNLGAAYENQGRFAEAISHLEKAIALGKNDVPIHYNLGLAYAKQGRWDEAVPCFQKAIALDPNDALAANAHGNLGAAYENQGRFAEAISHLEKAIALGKNDVPIHYNLGLAYAKQGRWDKAVPPLEKAIALDPNDASAHGNLGAAYENQGRFVEAISHLEKAIQLKKDYVPARYNLGLVYAKQGRLDEAIHLKMVSVLACHLLAEEYEGKGDSAGVDRCGEEIQRLLLKNNCEEKTYHLYQYLPLHLEVLENLLDNKLRFSRPEHFNDPFDCEITHKAKDLQEKKWWKAALGVGVCALSEVKPDKGHLLWSHYADKHKGICVCYEVRVEELQEEGVCLKKVQYQTKLPDFSNKGAALSNFAVIGGDWAMSEGDSEKTAPSNLSKKEEGRATPEGDLLAMKLQHWEYEKEYRLLSKEAEDKEVKGVRLYGLVFGCKTTEKQKKMVREKLKWKEGVTFFSMKDTSGGGLKTERFQIEEESQKA